MDNDYVAQKEEAEKPLEISAEQISEELLVAIIESFIQREGTDYGAIEASLDTKLRQVKKQIESGDVKIVFEQSTETVSLITARDFNKLFPQSQTPTSACGDQ